MTKKTYKTTSIFSKPESAFPETPENSGGLTKREYFAVQILSSILINYKPNGNPDEREQAVARAITWADELVKQLKK